MAVEELSKWLSNCVASVLASNGKHQSFDHGPRYSSYLNWRSGYLTGEGKVVKRDTGTTSLSCISVGQGKYGQWHYYIAPVCWNGMEHFKKWELTPHFLYSSRADHLLIERFNDITLNTSRYVHVLQNCCTIFWSLSCWWLRAVGRNLCKHCSSLFQFYR